MASAHSKRGAFAALALGALLMAAAPRDSATIVDSGSTNLRGYTIVVWSDGSATAALQTASPKPFTLPAATTQKFFADLAAAKKANAATVPCMKSASFGSSIHVTWHDWTSPDLTCPPSGDAGTALVNDVNAIQKASGINPATPRFGPVPPG